MLKIMVVRWDFHYGLVPDGKVLTCGQSGLGGLFFSPSISISLGWIVSLKGSIDRGSLKV